MHTLPTLPTLYPDVANLLATPPEDLVPLLLKFARHVLTLQNGMFDPNYVNQLATEANNIHLQRPRYSHVERREIETLLGEAWLFIEGERFIMPAPAPNGASGFRVFTSKGEALSDNFDIQKYRAAAEFPKSLMHPLIADKVGRALMRNDLDEAVFTSFKAVEEAVRSAGGYSANDLGTTLMRAAFDKNKGPLTDMSHPDGERDALAHLFAGAIGSYKNPHSHRTVNLTDLREAQEQVMLASHLLRIVEARRKP